MFVNAARQTKSDPLTAEGVAGRRRGPPPRAVLAVASLGAAVAFVDATIVNIAFPDIARSFPGTSISTLSWVLNAYNIVFAAFLVPAGRIADLAGRRRIFILGLEVFTVASLLCALAPSPGLLILFRVLQALGAAMLVPAALALVLNAFPSARRSHGVALLSAVAAAAAGLGPSLGGVLVSLDNWRLVFLVNLPIGGVAVVLARRRLVESRAPGRRRMPDLPGAALFALAIAVLVLGVVEGQKWGWAGWRTLGCFAAAAVLGAVFTWRCTWHRSPILDLPLLRIRTFSAANAMTVIAAAGFYGYTLTNVLFLTGVWRYSVLQAGLALTPGPFAAAAVAGPTSRLVLRIGHRPVLVAGGLIWGAAVLWFVEQVGATPDFSGQWLPGILLLGVGAGTLFPNLSGAAVAAAPGESFATATGLNSVARQVGAALGVALVVAIIGAPTRATPATFEHAWTFGSICLFAAGLGCLLVGRLAAPAVPSLTEAAGELRRVMVAADAAPRPRARRAFSLTAPTTTGTSTESIADFIRLAPLFAALDEPARERLASRTRPVHLRPAEWLFHEGDAADALYMVRAGRLEVVDEPRSARVRELGRGDVVGELGLLTEMHRSASVRALRSTELLAIDRGDFQDLLERERTIPVALTRTLAGQLRDARAPVSAARPLPATVAIVALGERAPIEELTLSLYEALNRLTRCGILRGGEVEAVDAGPATAVYGPVLDRAEDAHEVVLLSGGPIVGASPWTEFCLQQADRILAVSSPATGAIDARPELRGCDLVAWDVPAGSGALATIVDELTPIETHRLSRAQFEDDVERIARRLSGRSVGVVLSGGGARAFAHIGALEELLAAGVVIDRVAGVSMGAYIGALLAMGLGPEEIDARCFEEWVQRRPLSDYTLPRHALLRGERATAMLHRSFGTMAIEELPLSFMCGCAELRSGALVLARSGPLWESVGFSINLPVLSAPQVRGRNLFVDGSLIDNLPVKAMADMGEGPIIAVDVKATHEPAAPNDGASAAADRRRPSPTTSHPRVPSLGETLVRVLLLASQDTAQAAQRHADLVIKPRPAGVGLLEFHQIDAAREAGRAAARDALMQGMETSGRQERAG
jgi:NTE family protein